MVTTPVRGGTERRADLTRAETLLLLMLRLWVRALQQQQDGLSVLEQHCRYYRQPGVLASQFDTVIRIIANAARRPIDVRCPPCDGLSPDEARLLAAVAAAQHNSRPNDALADYTAPAGLRLLGQPLCALAASLHQARLSLPLRRWDFALLHSRAAPALAVNPSRTLH